MTFYRIDLTGGGQEVILSDQEWTINHQSGVITVYGLPITDIKGKDNLPIRRLYSPAGWRKLQAVDE